MERLAMPSPDVLEPPAGLSFGELLDWHLSRGTRPPGSDRQGEPWKKAAFAEDAGVSDKQVRNWVANNSFPTDTITIERILFGRDQKHRVTWRIGLRDALKRTRSGHVATDMAPVDNGTATERVHRPSIAVLPFSNMSGDPEQEYFADGVVEEVITALSRMRWLFVIARNSSFTYRGWVVDVKQVGRELGVRYVLEGSVRKAANRLRITAQLIDSRTGAHLWADRFEGAADDIFDLQDQVTERVVGAIAPKLEQAEIERSKHKPTQSLDAYDYYLRGMAMFHLRTAEATSEALQLFYKAIELDPDFSTAHGMAAWCYVRRKASRWMTDIVKETSEAARLARRALELGKEDAIALSAGGFALAYIVGQLDDGAAFIDQARELNPNLAMAWYTSGRVRIFLGEPEVAIEHLTHSMRLSPLDRLMFGAEYGVALAHFCADRFDEASSWAQKALRWEPNFQSALRLYAASNALAGRLEEAQRAIVRLRTTNPALRVSDLKGLPPLRRRQDVAKYTEGLRKAGLPD
jgi:TolB-like protein